MSFNAWLQSSSAVILELKKMKSVTVSSSICHEVMEPEAMIIYSLDIFLSYLEPVCCSMSGSNHCFLTYIQFSQEAGKVVWYSHLFKNFPQFVVIHMVKGFCVVNEAEVNVLEFPCFLYDPANVGSLTSGSSAFSKSSCYIWKFMYC